MKKNSKRMMLLAAICVMSSDVVVAQDTTQKKDLDEVIIRQRQKTTTISTLGAQKTEKISSRELLKSACCNLSESFETTPSVDVGFTDAVSGYKQIQMLGLASAYTAITRENIPDNRGLASYTGLTFTPGSFVESMQLSKGTGSVVNGFESVAGQINVEWRKPFEEKEEKWHFNLYQNTQARTEGNIVHRVQLHKNLSTNIFLHGKSQWMKFDQNNDGFLDQPLDKQFVGANRWFWFGPKGWEVQAGVKAVYVENVGGQTNYEKGMKQDLDRPWGFELNMKRVETWAKIGHVFTGKTATSIGLQLSGVYHSQDSRYGLTNYDATQKSFYANLIYQTILGNTNHVIKMGLSNLIDNYNETMYTTRYQRQEIVPGAFAEYTYNASDKFNVVAGLRGDYHNIFGAFATPRLHVRYAAAARSVFRASVGRAQRTANIFAENMSYMASGRGFVINRPAEGKAYGMNPEVAWNYGINFTQKFQLNYRDGSFSTDYYYTDFKNQIVADLYSDAHTVQFYNLNGRSFAHSFQAQLDYEVIRNLDVRLAYRWYDVKTTYNGVLKEKPLISAHRAFANIGYETRNHWKFDYTLNWIGSKLVPERHSHTNDRDEYYSPSYVLMNAQISKTWKDIFEIYLGAENLNNFMMHHPITAAADPYNADFDASLIWGPVMGRNIYAGFRYKIF
ncbi:MAG TPA: TonB-dependent receptor [Flavipsychrobacter sp.]|nr:TonB-dependent receptor [Flavipsychrobacter sp.]